MNEKELFNTALGIESPWRVAAIDLDVKNRKVEVRVECEQTVWADPATRERLLVHGYEERRWRHLDTMQFETYITARVPRLKYPDGRTELLEVPWADAYARHTLFLKHGPSASLNPAKVSKPPANCCGSSGMPLTKSWSGQ